MCKHFSSTSERYNRSQTPIRPSGTAASGSTGQASPPPAKNTRGLPTPHSGPRSHHATTQRDTEHHSKNKDTTLLLYQIISQKYFLNNIYPKLKMSLRPDVILLGIFSVAYFSQLFHKVLVVFFLPDHLNLMKATQ